MGANVNEIHEQFMTPLHLAEKFRSGVIVKLLLENGVDQNIASELGITPLAVIANFDNIKLAKMLLRAGTKCQCTVCAIITWSITASYF